MAWGTCSAPLCLLPRPVTSQATGEGDRRHSEGSTKMWNKKRILITSSLELPHVFEELCCSPIQTFENSLCFEIIMVQIILHWRTDSKVWKKKEQTQIWNQRQGSSLRYVDKMCCVDATLKGLADFSLSCSSSWMHFPLTWAFLHPHSPCDCDGVFPEDHISTRGTQIWLTSLFIYPPLKPARSGLWSLTYAVWQLADSTWSVSRTNLHVFCACFWSRMKQSSSKSTSTDPSGDADVGGCWLGSVAACWPCGEKPAGVPAHRWWVGWSALRGQHAEW